MKFKSIIGACAAVALASAALSTTAHAEDAKPQPNAYTECGIGAAIFNNNHVAAAISNVIWDWGTTALSSAVSSPDQCSGTHAKTAMLVGSSYAALETDIAVGQGKYLTALADVMNCQQSARTALYNDIRVSFADVATKPEFVNMTKDQKAAALYNVVDTTVATKYSATCAAV
ncbi:DUF3015 family protein [Asticcacaulis solisilvae]|uniref:DUF3015 family protein n=1 Tax=Asticcacaulis solisilvae TaxID=1217274 RepID=UPI003FD7D866